MCSLEESSRRRGFADFAVEVFYIDFIEVGSSRKASFVLRTNAWFNFTCYHPPPGNPRDKCSPSGPGVGNCLKRSCSGGRGVGQIEINFSFFLVKHVTSQLDTMAPDSVEKTAFFQGKSLEFVVDWLEKNNLSKLKSVFEGTFIINC